MPSDVWPLQSVSVRPFIVATPDAPERRDSCRLPFRQPIAKSLKDLPRPTHHRLEAAATVAAFAKNPAWPTTLTVAVTS